jgi:formamidopyrimidine-DNA glycosylase
LLDQSVVSGIGNIYADEALWRSAINGRRRGSALTSTQVRTLVSNAREVMLEALAQGGTSFDALYVNVNGESGYFERALDAYGREGEPCRRCGAAIRREAFMNRSSYRCPRCQRAPRGGAGTG